MFVPRALRLKGVREPPRLKAPQAAPGSHANDGGHDSEYALVAAMEKTSTTSPAAQQDAIEPIAPKKGPRFTTGPITPEYLAQLAAGMELIFTDYAHQEHARVKWLQDHYRTVDGDEKCT